MMVLGVTVKLASELVCTVVDVVAVEDEVEKVVDDEDMINFFFHARNIYLIHEVNSKLHVLHLMRLRSVHLG